MAQAIRTKASILDDFAVAWQHHFLLADQAGTTAVTTGGFGDLLAAASQPGAQINRWKIVVKLKVKVSTAGTSVRFNLQVDSALGFATNNRDLAEITITGASQLGTRVIVGFIDDAATEVVRYYQIVATVVGGGAITYDVEVFATPIQ